jgi:hypothetical protein
MTFIEKARAAFRYLNDFGVAIPLIRLDGKPTFTGTMTFISFNTALLGQIGKVTNFLGPVDLTQANYLFLMCLGAYLGRKIQGDGKKVDIAQPDPADQGKSAK